MYERFGKPVTPMLSLGKGMFDPAAQDALVAETRSLVSLYRSQPLRAGCKICATPFGALTFRRHDIDYFLCAQCGHLNGAHMDTEAYYRAQFVDKAGELVAAHYSSADRDEYARRVDVIYRPKAAFLREVVAELGENLANLSVGELGAGSGYFLSALAKEGCQNAFGYELASSQVAFGNKMLGADRIQGCDIEDLPELAANVDADVVALIFVLEHLVDPKALMKALRCNTRVRYTLVAVPAHSPTTYLQMAFPEVFERNLSAHTHMFSANSLDLLMSAAGMAPCGRWWFGADMLDLFRSIRTTLAHQRQPTAIEDWDRMILPLVDSLQRVMDEGRFSSEIHAVYRKTGTA